MANRGKKGIKALKSEKLAIRKYVRRVWSKGELV